MNELYHYGVKGMKWGVRNAETRARYRRSQHPGQRIKTASKTNRFANEIVSTFSDTDREKFDIEKDAKYISFEQGQFLAKRILVKNKDVPVSFVDIYEGKDSYNVAIGTRSGDQYRGKGYGYRAAKRGVDWYERNADILKDKPLSWGVRVDNDPSIKIAESLGFKRDPNSYSDDKRWVNYELKPKERTVFISGSSKT